MNHNEEPFHPDEVDEQIEQELHGTASLAQELQHLYKDDMHRLEQIRERLTFYEHYGKKAKPPIDIQRYQQRKVQRGQYETVSPPVRKSAPSGRRFGTLVSGLVAAVILLSVLAFSTVLQRQQAHFNVTSRDLFLYDGQNAVHMDSITKKVYWQYHIPDPPVGTPLSPIVTNNSVYVESQDGIYAIDIATGRLLWSYNLQISPYVTHKAKFVLSGGSLFVPDVNKILYQFNATDGTLIHKFPLHLDTSVVSFTIDNNVLYANGLYDMCAMSLTNGSQLWYKVLNLRIGMPHIVKGVIYLVTTSDVSWPTPESDSYSYINAFDAHTGDALWQSAKIPAVATDIALSNNVIYAGATDGSVQAYDVQDGHLVWGKIVDNMSFSDTAPVVDAGVLYLDAKDPTQYNSPLGVIAVDASSGLIRWQYPASFQEMERAGHIFGPPLVVLGIVYVIDTNTSELYAISDGVVLWHARAR